MKTSESDVRRQAFGLVFPKLSPIDEASLGRLGAYTDARNAMFFHTDTAQAPWTVVNSNEKRRARVESIRTVN